MFVRQFLFVALVAALFVFVSVNECRAEVTGTLDITLTVNLEETGYFEAGDTLRALAVGEAQSTPNDPATDIFIHVEILDTPGQAQAGTSLPSGGSTILSSTATHGPVPVLHPAFYTVQASFEYATAIGFETIAYDMDSFFTD